MSVAVNEQVSRQTLRLLELAGLPRIATVEQAYHLHFQGTTRWLVLAQAGGAVLSMHLLCADDPQDALERAEAEWQRRLAAATPDPVVFALSRLEALPNLSAGTVVRTPCWQITHLHAGTWCQDLRSAVPDATMAAALLHAQLIRQSLGWPTTAFHSAVLLGTPHTTP